MTSDTNNTKPVAAINTNFVKRYCESLIEKVSFLENYIDNSEKIKTNNEPLLQCLHKLVGSGGMYGFDELSTSAMQLHEKVSSFNEESIASADENQDVDIVLKDVAELISIINNIIVKNN